MLDRITNYIKKQIPLNWRNRHRQDATNFILNVSILSKRLIRLFLKPVVAEFHDGKPLKVHLGCGPIILPGYINVDIRPYSHVHYVHGVDTLPMLKSNSVQLIYVSHVLEHFSMDQIADILKEWHRPLCQNGVLRISVPDFDKLADIYMQTGRDLSQLDRF